MKKTFDDTMDYVRQEREDYIASLLWGGPFDAQEKAKEILDFLDYVSQRVCIHNLLTYLCELGWKAVGDPADFIDQKIKNTRVETMLKMAQGILVEAFHSKSWNEERHNQIKRIIADLETIRRELRT
jgi:hypothetical protein